MSRIKIAVAQDRPRPSLAGILRNEQNFQIDFEAENETHLIEALQTASPDIIIMNMEWTFSKCLNAIRVVRGMYPAVKIIAIVPFDTMDQILELTRLGVKSIIHTIQLNSLAFIIHAISQGGVYFPEDVATVLYGPVKADEKDEINLKLTSFDRAHIDLICQGLSSTEIGKIFFKSHRTIEDHRQKLYRIFHVDNKEKFIAEVFRRKIL